MLKAWNTSKATLKADTTPQSRKQAPKTKINTANPFGAVVSPLHVILLPVQVFREGDWDDSSDLSLAELESIMQDMAWRHNVHYDDEDDQLHRLSREVMEDLDQDKSGTLSEKEWLKYLKSETH
mmetsp:Transcript_4770/g.7647  ORF Transcript_4770/g.7647 Transcript_4770/m.7647 type:complete len:124 (-) Transcript_4770:856-1227(-)